MAERRSLDDEKIDVDSILESLSSRFDATYEELLEILKNEPKFKRLKRIGEKQFYEATSESTMEMESQNTRLRYAEMNLMAEEVQKAWVKIISNKFKGNFLNILKEEVLNSILKSHSEQKHVMEESTESDTVLSQAESSAENQNCSRKVSDDNLDNVRIEAIDLSYTESGEKILSEKTKVNEDLDTINISGDNQNGVRKVIDLSDTENAEKILSMKNKVNEGLDTNNSKSDDGNVTIGSFSSVHTSDLSSFDDSLVFSSDEESGIKGKRMSMEAAGERLAELKSKKLSAKKSEENQHEDASTSKNALNESSSVSQKSSHRLRKPNSKYISDEVIMPLRKSTKKFSTSTPASKGDNSLPRKRGRPKKN